jgi:hypothetical protein
MLDEQEAQPVTEAVTPAEELSREIGSSLASVWARYVGSRPESGETELNGNAVRWTHAGGDEELAEALANPDDVDAPTRSPKSYRRELGVAVARATHRRVAAMIHKQDAEAGTATVTFILEAPHRSN